MRPSRHGVLLAAIVSMALLHALMQARVRPLYQVSDEMNYIFAGQERALVGASPVVAACVAPPDGTLLQNVGPGGKAGHRRLTGAALRWLCRDGGPLPLFPLRALHALAFPVLVLAAWGIGLAVSGPRAGLIAALVAAMHPVAAKYAGAVSPDAWANAWSALAFLAGARLLVGRGRWWDVPLLLTATGLALAWKETTYALIPHAALVLVVLAGRLIAAPGPTLRRAALALAIGVLGVGAVTGAWRYRAMFQTTHADALTRAQEAQAASLPQLGSAALHDVATHAGGFLGSSVLSLYRPWVYTPGQLTRRGQPLTPDLPLIILGLFGLCAVAGLAMAWSRGAAVSWTLVAIWALTGVVLLLQPSVRQVLLRTNDLHQGRWLFPMLAPVAAVVGIGLAEVVGRRAQGLSLMAIGAVTTIWVVLIDIVRHHYLVFPDQVRRSSLFVRPTGDIDIGDASVTAIIEAVARAQPLWTFWGPLGLLAVTSLALVWLAARVSREELS